MMYRSERDARRKSTANRGSVDSHPDLKNRRIAISITAIVLGVVISSVFVQAQNPSQTRNLERRQNRVLVSKETPQSKVEFKFDQEQRVLENQIRQLETRLQQAKAKLAERAALRDQIVKFRLQNPSSNDPYADTVPIDRPLIIDKPVANLTDSSPPVEWKHHDGALLGVTYSGHEVMIHGKIDDHDRIVLRIGKTETTAAKEWSIVFDQGGRLTSTVSTSDLIPLENNQTATGIVFHVQCDDAGISRVTNIPLLEDASTPDGEFNFMRRVYFQNDAPLQIGYIQLPDDAGKVPVTICVESRVDGSSDNGTDAEAGATTSIPPTPRPPARRAEDMGGGIYKYYSRSRSADKTPKFYAIKLKPSFQKWMQSHRMGIKLESTRQLSEYEGRGDLNAGGHIIRTKLGWYDDQASLIVVESKKFSLEQAYTDSGAAAGIHVSFSDVLSLKLDGTDLKCDRLSLTWIPYDIHSPPRLSLREDVRLASGAYEFACDRALICNSRARLTGRVEAIKKSGEDIEDVFYAQEIDWDLAKGEMLPSSPTNFKTSALSDPKLLQVQELQGIWQVEEVDGKNDVPAPKYLSFDGNDLYWSNEWPDAKAEKRRAQLKAADCIIFPHLIDFLLDNPEGNYTNVPGIYRFDGEHLIYCYSTEAERPTSFQANSNGTVVLKLKRAEKPETESTKSITN